MQGDLALKAGIKIYGGIPGILSSVSFTYEVVLNVVTFADTSTENPTQWLWSFGDGQISVEQDPVHTYGVAGSYGVVLTVTNGNGSSASVPVTIGIV